MATEGGAGRSAGDIHAVADPNWFSRATSESGAEPFLDDEGAVVIPVVSGSGPLLQGAPSDRTIKLPALGAHQALVTVALGPSMLQRVIIDAHERLEEVSLNGTGRIDDLTVNASRDDREIRLIGQAEASVLRLRGTSFAIHQELIRPTTVIDLRDTVAGSLGGWEGSFDQLQLSGSVQIRGSWRVRSSLVRTGAIIDVLPGNNLWLGVVNPEQEVSDPPPEMTLRMGGGIICAYLPPATKVGLDQTSLQLERPEPLSAAPPEDKAVARFLQAPPTILERLTITGAGRVHVRWDLESPIFSPEGGELALRVNRTGNVMNASGRVVLEEVAEDALCQGSAHSPLTITSVGKVDGAELERIDIYDLSVGDVRRLQPAARVTPWIPPPGIARRRERAMRLGTDNEQLQAERRADFWTKLAILSTQQVLGSVQSNVRLASMRARRKALPWGRERFWLSAFSLIGYGERILQPLLIWLGGVVIASLAYAAVVGIPSGIASLQFAELFGRLLLGPLAILRVDELRPPNAPGPWDMVIWIAALILGTVCLGFSLVAIRKVTRAAH